MFPLNIKKTPARVAVTEFLNKSKEPVDVSQIISYLRRMELGTNKVTVYRIMDYLYQNGIVDKMEFGEGKFRYEMKKNHHHHLICTDCGQIEEVEGDFLKKLEEEVYKTKGFKVKSHSLEFFGLCKNCLSKQN
jgi:Fur family ferric uptake transcriptional regulator